MADELVDIFDESYRFLGHAMKSTAHKTGLWHHSIHCWIVRPAGPGYVLFQKRAADKVLFPNLLDISAAGHYQADEPIEAGIREIIEEVGLDVPFSSLVPLGIKIDIAKYDDIHNRELCHVFLLNEPQPPRSYVLNSEVDGFVEISIRDGFSLFTGAVDSVKVSGVERRADRSWHDYDGSVTRESFIPRVDPYYLKIFIMAERLLEGRSPLAI